MESIPQSHNQATKWSRSVFKLATTTVFPSVPCAFLGHSSYSEALVTRIFGTRLLFDPGNEEVLGPLMRLRLSIRTQIFTHNSRF